jgi:quinol monooxygenase YgiN
MHVRINEVTVSPARVDELGDVLANKALPVLLEQPGCKGLLCSADRATGSCTIVSRWDSRESLDASESAVASMRSETVDALDAELDQVSIAEVLREVTATPTRAGNRSRVVRVTAPAGTTGALIDFYGDVALPRLQEQAGFLSSRIIQDVDDETRFAAISHWADEAALKASEASSAGLREAVPTAVAGASIMAVTTGEIVFIELTG